MGKLLSPQQTWDPANEWQSLTGSAVKDRSPLAGHSVHIFTSLAQNLHSQVSLFKASGRVVLLAPLLRPFMQVGGGVE